MTQANLMAKTFLFDFKIPKMNVYVKGIFPNNYIKCVFTFWILHEKEKQSLCETLTLPLLLVYCTPKS